MDIKETIFLISFIFIIYIYLGYPFILILISFFYRNDNLKGKIEPNVSIIISAYNEEKAIREKLKIV